MIRKCDNHTLLHREEGTQNTNIHRTPGRESKKATSSRFSTDLVAKLEGHRVLNNKTRTKHRAHTNSGINIKQ